LDDQGQADRARLIRIELEMDALGSRTSRYWELWEEQKGVSARAVAAVAVPAALRRKLTFSWGRGLLEATVRNDVRLTPADFRTLAGLAPLKTLKDFDRLPPDRLANLSLAPNVQRLTCGGRDPLPEEVWPIVVGLPQIERLALDMDSYGRVTDEDLRRLAAMPQLKEIDLGESKVTDAGLAHVKGLTRLEVLRVYEAPITDAGLEHLSGLVRMKELSLPHSLLTLAGLQHLLPMKGLKALNLASRDFEGDPVPILVSFRKLRKLNLDEIRGVNDDGLKVLARKLPELRELSLRLTSVTRFRLARLLPKTKWKLIHLETTLDVATTHEEKEIEAFKEFCLEHGAFAEVDLE
jgi:hypothetical protein